MARFNLIPGGEYTAAQWVSYDWPGYPVPLDFDPLQGPPSRYAAENALYMPLANANAGGGVALARDQARAIIAQNAPAWDALGINESTLGATLTAVHAKFYDRLYNVDKNDLIDVIGQGAVKALLFAAAGNLVGLPSPGDLLNKVTGAPDLSGIPDDLGYDFKPQALDGSALPAVDPYEALRGIPDDLGNDFRPQSINAPALPAPGVPGGPGATLPAAATSVASALAPLAAKLLGAVASALTPAPAPATVPGVVAPAAAPAGGGGLLPVLLLLGAGLALGKA